MSRFTKYMGTVFAKTGFTNAISNGNLANETTGWTHTYKRLVLSNDSYDVGSQSLDINCNGDDKQFANSPTFWANAFGDKFYVCIRYKVLRFTSGSPAIRVMRGSGGYDTILVSTAGLGSAPLNEWLLASNIRTVLEAHNILNMMFTAGGSGNFDAQILLDCAFAYNLTSHFGAGNEPDVAWCNTNIVPSIVW